MSAEKVYLRPITAADTAKVVNWRNKDFVRKNFIYQEPFTEEGHRAWLREQVETGHVAQFIICVGDADGSGNARLQSADAMEIERDDREIGSVYLRDIDREAGTAEYGVFIGEEDALGRGYGTVAAKLALAYGFTTLQLQKIFLRLLENNEGARRSYVKAGFRMIEDRRDSVTLEQGEEKVLFMEIGRGDWEMTRGKEEI